MTEKILVIGSSGQIGSELIDALSNRHSALNVIAADIRMPESPIHEGHFEVLDVLDRIKVFELVKKHDITQIYLLAAILSASAEEKVQQAWKLNMDGLFNVLEICRQQKLKLFWPSSIAVFGPGTVKKNTPQNTFMDPSTVYGISKLAGERWCEYYFNKYNVDVRSLRYPGLIGYKSQPGGGTTDYAVHIFHEAKKKKSYECFLNADTMLPMMYMPDALRATLELMNADSEKIKIRSSYNIAAMSFSPKQIAEEIQKHIPEFTCTYRPDARQGYAASWPGSIDDSPARNDWGWQHEYDLAGMTKDMLEHIQEPFVV